MADGSWTCENALGMVVAQALLLVALVAEGVRLGLRSLGMPRTDQG